MEFTKLGLIAGNGELPQDVIDAYEKKGGKCFVASIAGVDFISHSQKKFLLGEVGAIVSYFKENDVKDVVIIGGIKRPNFSQLKLDFMGAALLSKIMHKKIRGDDNVLRIVANFLESKSINVIAATDILTLYQNKIKTTAYPSKQELEDIKLGEEIIVDSLSKYDIGQSAIIYGGYVLGVEGAEGTDKLISRCFSLRQSKRGGVLIKIPKSTQDLRLDIPTIGPNTIKNLSENGFNGIAISKNVIVVSYEETALLLEKNKIFLHYI